LVAEEEAKKLEWRAVELVPLYCCLLAGLFTRLWSGVSKLQSSGLIKMEKMKKYTLREIDIILEVKDTLPFPFFYFYFYVVRFRYSFVNFCEILLYFCFHFVILLY